MGDIRFVEHGPIGHEPLQVAYGHRLTLLSPYADRLTLVFLGTDPTADRGKGVIALENGGGP
jgi:hypothetical protein